ncbi:MAG: dienelactone hydrolase family protein [Acidimicrobiia bacterium]|nr:dienelactone hydrolase family protein [Acidimicrobiia bacterium]
MALLKGEGTHQILYGSADIFSGLRHNRGYVARPDHAGSFPAVILLHGAAGISSSVKSFARRLARHGLAVVGPDLFRGVPSRLSPPYPAASQVLADAANTLHWAASPDTAWVRPGPIGVVALDRAASAAVEFAAAHDVGGLALVAPVLEPTVVADVAVLGFYGKDDEVVGDEDRAAVQEALSHGEWVLYGGAGHGLIDDSAPDYRWDVGEDVTARMVRFFGVALEP